MTRWVEPVGGSLRIDTHCYGGYTVPPHYDSLLAKLIAHGRDRDHAVMRSSKAAYVALDHGYVHLTLSRPSSSTV